MINDNINYNYGYNIIVGNQKNKIISVSYEYWNTTNILGKTFELGSTRIGEHSKQGL